MGFDITCANFFDCILNRIEPSLFCQDVAQELTKELQGKPDLIIGNYSDGNIVASLLAHKLGVTQVCDMICL